jgi:hypothetical protein
VTWDTLDTNPYAAQFVTLSGGGLIATGSSGLLGGGANGVAQPFEGKTAGKWCVEIHCIASGGGDDVFGLTCAASAVKGSQYGFIGSTGGTEFTGQSGIGYRQDGDINNNRLYLIGQSPIAHWGAWGAGDYLYLAVDLDHGWCAFRINGGPWLGTTNTADPVSGTGCIAFSATQFAYPPLARVFPAVGMGNGGQYAFNLGASGFANPVSLTGFINGWTNTGPPNLGSLLGNGLGAIYNTNIPQVLVSPYVSPFTGTITRLRCAMANGATTQSAFPVVYDSDGTAGAPHTLLAHGSPAGGGTETSLNLTAPLSVTMGHTYYLGVGLNAGTVVGHSSLALAGGAADLWTDSTITWPTPNSVFVQSAVQNFHLPILAEGSGGGGGGGGAGAGYSFGDIF